MIFRQENSTLAEVSPEELLRLLQAHAISGNYQLSDEALTRAKRLGHSAIDMRHVLASATHCASGGDSQWHVFGPSLDGHEIRIVVTLDSDGVTLV